jgi:aspartokinase-like uncharacterized kinase
MTASRLLVAKVGGSLLDTPRLGAALQHWLARRPREATLLLAGGGPLADWVRAADRRHGLGEEAAHWAAVRTLSVTAVVLAKLLPKARLQRDWESLRVPLQERPAGAVWVLDPWDFLAHYEARLPGNRLPASWVTTSDSIAARLAVVSGADELVLFKSRDAPDDDLAALRNAGFVDDAFPSIAAHLPSIRFVNLRRYAPAGDSP